ncbi:hypothetical protein, partial [Mediterraneibacter sp.]
KISSPICDAIICNNKSNHFISIQLFLTNTLKLTTLPVLRVGGGDWRSAHTDVRSQKHASMFCASRTLYGRLG